MLGLATTGHYAEDGALHSFPVEPRLRWAAERSLRALGDEPAVAALLENDESERFDELHAALPASTRAAVDALSPVRALPNVEARVEVAFDPHDRFFSPAEARALERAGAHVTRTPALGHVRPPGGVRRRSARSFRRPDAAAQTRSRIVTAQPLRFLGVGICGYAVNLGAFVVIYGAGGRYAAASVAAYLVANVFMYLGNRYLTFRLGHAGFWAAYARYLLVGCGVAALAAAVLAALVELTGLGPRVAQPLALLAVAPVAFALFKRVSFRLS